MPVNHPPFLDLFLQLREAGMPLSLEQYDLLQQSLGRGVGVGGWDDLQRVCAWLWVKQPPGSEEARRFEQVFEQYRRLKQEAMPMPKVPPKPPKQEASFEGVLPQIPPRKLPDAQAEAEDKAPVAVQSVATRREPARVEGLRLKPRELPISVGQVQSGWRLLRRPVAEGLARELDVDATIERICSEGLFGDVVMRPVVRRRTELLLLMDDAGAMVPFRPALKPLLDAVGQGRVSPGRVYRFTAYPDEYLYDPQDRGRAVPLRQVLSRLHERRTVVMVVSDAGAATRRYSPERVQETQRFWGKLLPCVRQVLWLNPLPRERWVQTSAVAIAKQLAVTQKGKMLPLSDQMFCRLG